MSEPKRTTYTIELDGDGHRFWLCEHSDGRLEPLPPESQLLFRAGEDDNGKLQLPVGARVTIEVPDQSQARQVEREHLKRAMRDAVKKQYEAIGQPKSDAEADAIVAATIAEMVAKAAGTEEKNGG